EAIEMKSRSALSTRSDGARAGKLKVEESFQPCPAEPGDELFPNGIFEFNITQRLAFVEANVAHFPIKRGEVEDIPDYGGENLDGATICAADVSLPILLVEISSGLFNLN